MAEGVVVLEPGDERAQIIAKAMANKTSSKVLNALKERELTSSEIADILALPITTVTYHIENLLKADMIEVVSTRWSQKGREVKIYGVRDQLVIMAPTTTDIRDVLLKYASLFSIFMFATILIAVVAPLVVGTPPGLGEMTAPQNAEGVLKVGATEETFRDTGMPGGPDIHTYVLAFFGGGCVILLLLMLYEIFFFYRRSR